LRRLYRIFEPMKTTLFHLTQPRQALVMEAVEIIKQVINPEAIILFGSYAKGTLVEQRYVSQGITYDYTSDIDFLVVTKGDTAEPSEQQYQVFKQTEHFRPSVNMEIHEIGYINEGLEFGQYFFADIMKEGVLLYDKGNIVFSEKKLLSPAEEKDIAQKYFDIWFPNGQAFLKNANFSLTENDLKIGVFVLHQAAESLYYATLLVFTGYKPKTHNLFKLRKQAREHSIELFEHFAVEADKSERDLFDLLKRAYLDARYNPEYFITADQLKALIDRVQTMQQIVKRICEEKIASFTA
jgi:HEPN domain-containing protein/predicted nucleotidyltransferase